MRPPAQREPGETPQDAARHEHEREQPVDPHRKHPAELLPKTKNLSSCLVGPQLMHRQTARTAKPSPRAFEAFPPFGHELQRSFVLSMASAVRSAPSIFER